MPVGLDDQFLRLARLDPDLPLDRGGERPGPMDDEVFARDDGLARRLRKSLHCLDESQRCLLDNFVHIPCGLSAIRVLQKLPFLEPEFLARLDDRGDRAVAAGRDVQPLESPVETLQVQRFYLLEELRILRPGLLCRLVVSEVRGSNQDGVPPLEKGCYPVPERSGCLYVLEREGDWKERETLPIQELKEWELHLERVFHPVSGGVVVDYPRRLHDFSRRLLVN